jgi:hypothetical protein
MAVIEIELGAWTDEELREDAKRCMIALAPLSEDSPVRTGLVHVVASIVTELQHRSPSVPSETPATMCRCGEVFTTPDDATMHFVNVFVPANNVGPDGRIHEEITGPDGKSPALTVSPWHGSGM